MGSVLFNCFHFALGSFLSIWLALSPVVFAVWIIDPIRRDQFADAHPKVYVLTSIGACFTFYCVVARGVRELVFFWPVQMGVLSQDHALFASRGSIAHWAALLALLLLSRALDRLYAVEYRERVLSEARVQKGRIEDLALEPLREELEEIRTRLTSLRNSPSKDLTRNDRRWLDILTELLPEVERLAERAENRQREQDEGLYQE